jgi:phosphoglycerate-specific signal transduction histidine kinase
MSKLTLQTKFRYDKIKRASFVRNYGRVTVLKYLQDALDEIQELREREVEIMKKFTDKIVELEKQNILQSTEYAKLEAIAKDLALHYFLK